MPPKTSVAADPALDALAELVHTLRTLHLASGGHQQWLCLGLTMAQFKSVMLLVFTGGMTSRALADQLGVGPSAVTQLVDRLIDQRLVKRESDANDRRISWIRPTAKAMTLQQDLMQASRTLMAEMLDGLSARERHTVETALRLLLSRAKTLLAART